MKYEITLNNKTMYRIFEEQCANRITLILGTTTLCCSTLVQYRDRMCRTATLQNLRDLYGFTNASKNSLNNYSKCYYTKSKNTENSILFYLLYTTWCFNCACWIIQ